MSEEGEYVDVAIRFYAPLKQRIDRTELLVAVQRMIEGSGLAAMIQASGARAAGARVLRDDFS